jgi:outer membrane immunogenic protein
VRALRKIHKGYTMQKHSLYVSFYAVTAIVALLIPTKAFADGMTSSKSKPAMPPAMSYEAPPMPTAPWTGFYLGAGLGSGSVVHKLSADAPGFGNLATFDGIGGTGILGKLSVGYDRQIAPSWVVGAFLDYDFSGVKTELNVPIIPFNAQVKNEHTWTVGGRLGYLTSPSTLWYSMIGYTQTEYKLDTSVPGFTLDIPKFSGYMLGSGVESQLRDGWSMKAEYRYAKYGSENVFSGGGIDIGLQPVTHTGFVGLSYKFGRDEYLSQASQPMK